ncbi:MULTISPECIES: NAD(P)H-dependent oxidoreductase [Mesorhizobium]|uniref:FMN reductase n=1 Tax=Mesorhizobium robiniae TaxID=559315 RepID=A0ABV2GXE5_9HYPH|nr:MULTISPECIES: NAD(P)H-dependent oxidoreductase [Mesorhizobium]MCV3243393.1 NAD(P)H-dependent oxidoreductase [Mesorhizobium sp. ZC-5]
MELPLPSADDCLADKLRAGGKRMTRLRVVAFSGNFRRPSKTLALTNAIVSQLAQKTSAEIVTYDLLDLDESVCTFDRADLSQQSARIIGELESADALIVATPIYKGAYCGLMKHIFDLLPADALCETPVLISANGGGPRHALVIEHQLRPLFGFFEADTLPTCVYSCEADFKEDKIVDPGVLARIDKATNQMAHRLDELGEFSSESSTLVSGKNHAYPV